MSIIQGFTDGLLPSIYVKNITLDSQYQTKLTEESQKGSGYIIEGSKYALYPDDQANSKVTLSTKFIRTNNFESDIRLLFDAGLIAGLKIFAHQITSKSLYNNFVTPSAGENAFTDLNGNLTMAGRKFLQTDNTNVNISHRQKTFTQAMLDNNASLNNGQDSIVLPEQILDDGTIINEIIFEFDFPFPDSTDFLAYIMTVGFLPVAINSIDNGPDGFVPDPVYALSSPKKEIVILDGALQNRGLLFTIAPFSSNEKNITEKLKFGRPGDVWAGPVHEHEGVFMAGASHSMSKPHPRLQYSIEPVTKFVDNRIKEKIEKSILNTTNAFETLNSLTTVYQGQPNFLDFQQYKSKTYISDMYLSQDKNKNIDGMFFVDKIKILKNNSAFSAMFDTAKANYSPEKYSAFLDKVLPQAELIAIRVYEKDELLGYLSGDQITFEGENKNTKNSFKMDKRADLFMPGAINATLEIISFKHIISSSTVSHYDYRVEVEYIDPTIEIVKTFYSQVKNDANIISNLINFVNGQNGFNPVTHRIQAKTLQDIVANPNFSTTEVGTPAVTNIIFGPLQSQGLEDILYAFYNITDVAVADFQDYFVKIRNLSTVTQDGLLVLQKFVNDMANKMAISLTNVDSKPTTDDGNPYGAYGSSVSSIAAAETYRKTISVASKINRIRTYDYGYDFTGALDMPSYAAAPLDMRSTNNFLSISRDSFAHMCHSQFNRISAVEAGQIPGEPDLDVLDLYDMIFLPADVPFQNTNSTPRRTMFSYLNIDDHAGAIEYQVILPETIFSLPVDPDPDFPLSVYFNSQKTLTAIVKLNNFIIDDNSFSMKSTDNNIINMRLPYALKEDLISILASRGTSLLEDGTPIYELVQKVTNTIPIDATESVNEKNFIQKSSPISNPANKPFSFANNPGANSKNGLPNIDAEFGAKGNSFKSDPLFKQKTLSTMEVKTNLDTSKNVLMNSLMTRQLFTSAGQIMSFDLKKSISPDGYQAGITPNQISSLMPMNPNLGNPFKDFSSHQDYISNFVVNPDFLSEYWFKHQNIVKVEYLHGFEIQTETHYLKNNDNPFVPPKSIQTTERNVSKPIWKLLTSDFITLGNTGSGILCRLTRYEDSQFINSHLVKELNMPLINSYFIITN